MDIITRAQAGLRPPKYVNRGAMLAQSTCHYNGPDIIVAGRKSWDHSKCAGLVRGIQNFHMDGRGWSDIAYNFVICPHGYTFEGRGLNTYNGANGTTSGNKSSHAIMCLAGEGNTFTDAEKVEFKQCVEYVVRSTRCHGGCKGHRDHKSTACPGDIRYRWVHAGMPIIGETKPPPAPAPSPQPTLEYTMDTLDLRNAHKKVVKGRHVDNLQALLIPILAMGNRGDLVSPLLNGYGIPDGVAGKGTQTALKVGQDILRYVGALQQSSSDMVCGSKTWKAIIEF